MGNHVFLKISHVKGVIRFGKSGKFSPHYIEPIEILDRVGIVAFRLALPADLSMIHSVFHVFMLWKYILDPSHILAPQAIQLNESLSVRS